MEEREILLKLDRETKQILCRLLSQYAESLREKAEGQKTFTRLLIAHEMERTNDVLNQITTQWGQALPSLPAPPPPAKPGDLQ
ncbi:hypothetical protein [Lihuaxuella thermophila]|uniref:Uncharacterized protein n=1 Tax=Lihuaxuella thermophila TaxID=1173111 RepID=A0A1H8BF28_9BACL|nr:hypothetical protein [Lihuaxuella thermophila]SEM81465.1 hypothetical protein SAMN05444955_102152 [Lihuaxuella thermophila]